MLKIGVLGVGHLGKIHLGLLLQLPELFEVVGFYDADQINASQVATKFNVKSYDNIADLISAVDCLDIVTPTINHFLSASQALRNRKHIFIEKPLSETMEEAKILVQLANEADVVVQVGHVERFNPAFASCFRSYDS